ncbi:IclR family transcriptional regulator [Rhodococcus sp. NPDC003322]
MIATDDTPSSVLDRVALLLSAFDDESSLTLSEIVDRTGLPRSSIHRMLNRLVMLQWLRRTDRNYQLGRRFIELGSLAREQDTLHRVALPLMHELHRITGMVVHLGILDGCDVVYIEKVGGILGTTVPTRAGSRFPASRSALGRALLAYVNTDTGPECRTESLAAVRENGIAVESGQVLRGFSCLAAPIGPPGEPVAAISICGPSPRMKFDHQSAGPVRMTAGAVWRNLNHGPRSADTRRVNSSLQALPSTADARG